MESDLDEIIRKIRKRVSNPETAMDMDGRRVIHPPTTLGKIKEAEAALGFPLPAVLKRLYIEVANGGFGPGYGMAGVDGCGADLGNNDLVALHLGRTSNRWRSTYPDWPLQALNLAYLGCGMYVVADCSAPEVPMFLFEPNVSEEDLGYKNCLIPFDCTLEEWLNAWADGADVQCPASYTDLAEDEE